MPEFPEVHTTVRGINETVKGLIIKSVWSDYPLLKHKNKKHIKDVSYFNNCELPCARERRASILLVFD